MELASLEIRIDRSENLPVLPQAVSKILKLADDPNSSAREMEQIIERDPAISAKLLKVANSAYYGAVTVPTIGRAISFLGMNTVRSLAVSVAFQQMAMTKNRESSFDRFEYWRHSLATATACRIIGKLKFGVKAEELYCAGIIHDVGMLVMERFMPSNFEESLRQSIGSRRPLHEIEMDNLGYSHTVVSSLLARKWGFSKLIQNATQYHLDPELDPDCYDTTCVLHVANALAHEAGFTNSMPNVKYEVMSSAAMAINLPPEQFPVIIEVITQEVGRAEDAMAA